MQGLECAEFRLPSAQCESLVLHEYRHFVLRVFCDWAEY